VSEVPRQEDPALEAVASPRFVELAQKLKLIAEERDEFRHERDEFKKLYKLLLEENERLKRGLLGQKAERLRGDDAQLTLQMLSMILGEDFDAGAGDELEAKETLQTVPAHKRRKPKRKPLPEEYPRITIDIIPEEVQRGGLDNFKFIGQQVREVLERRPATCVVVRMVKKKFMPKDPEPGTPTQILVAETPELPIERGLAGPGFLADTIVKRWQDHLPLNRLESIFARDGLDIARSTMCGWHEQLTELVAPLVAAMKAEALTMPYLCVDATGVLVQAKDKCKSAHFWVLVAPERHVLFEFSLRHDGKAVDRLLPGYTGYLVADAHSVYDHLYKDGKVTEVGCWAHGRRYFFKSLASDPERARTALGMINALFRVERTIADSPRKKREAVRQKKSGPVVDRFYTWCEAEVDRVLDHTPISKAIGYVRNQEQALRRFLSDGRLPLHNNISELNLRREAVGRKNWLFVGSDDGARANTTFVSLLASCAMHKIEPWAYLRDLLCLMPSWPQRRVLDLAPANWKQTLQDQDTQDRLAANIYRQAVLSLDS